MKKDTSSPLWLRYLKGNQDAVNDFIQFLENEKKVYTQGLYTASEMNKVKEYQGKVQLLNQLLLNLKGE